MSPFYWAGPDGSSVLTWVSPEGYLEGSFHWELHNPDGFANRLEALERAGYPYDAILIIDGYGDNASVDKILSKLDAIRRLRFNLNEVEITYSTIDEFFHYMEETYGDTFPTLSGDWGRSWEVSRLAGPWQMAETERSNTSYPQPSRFRRSPPSSRRCLPRRQAGVGLETTSASSANTRAGPGTGWPDS